jgi:type III secretion protein V
LGVQEVANLINTWNSAYPDLIKEMLRVVTPQHLAEVLRRLVQEGISITNLRNIFGALVECAAHERDLTLLTEQVRQHLRHQISTQFSDSRRVMKAILLEPEFEESLRSLIRQAPGSWQNQALSGTDPTSQGRVAELIKQLHQQRPAIDCVLLCAADIRIQLRRLLEVEFPTLVILSYAELTSDIAIDSQRVIDLPQQCTVNPTASVESESLLAVA